MSGDTTQKTIKVVYEIDGVPQAVDDQRGLKTAVDQAGASFERQNVHVEAAESAYANFSAAVSSALDGLEGSRQAVGSYVGALGTLSSILGTESDTGALLGRMAHFGQLGVQIGGMFGPEGAVVGGILGSTVPAIGSLIDALTPTVPAIREVTDEARDNAAAIIEMGESFVGAGDRMREFLAAASTSGRASALADTNAQIAELADRIAAVTRNGTALERLDLPALRDRMEALSFEAEQAGAGIRGEQGEERRGRPRRGGSRTVKPKDDGFNEAIGFAAGLPPGAMEEWADPNDIATARDRGRARTQGVFASQAAATQRAQMEAIKQVDRLQQEKHAAQMARIQEQVNAWTTGAQTIGNSLYQAFILTVSGQEKADVAFVKSFKSLAIQFGGQMVSEGIGALLTAAGNSVAAPPVAATKAIEGAGKIALGVGLGAAGAAIPVPGAAATQSKPPRLGPDNGQSGVVGGVVVNMNAPTVVAGSSQVVGRAIGATLEDARNRYGRAV